MLKAAVDASNVKRSHSSQVRCIFTGISSSEV